MNVGDRMTLPVMGDGTVESVHGAKATVLLDRGDRVVVPVRDVLAKYRHWIAEAEGRVRHGGDEMPDFCIAALADALRTELGLREKAEATLRAIGALVVR